MTTKLFAPTCGELFNITESSDEVFANEIAGRGIFIIPEDQQNLILAPCDGKIAFLHDSNHAVMIETKEIVVLIHIGIDTITMKGKCFEPCVKVHDIVKVGAPLMKVNFSMIKQKGLKCDVIITIAEPLNVQIKYPATSFIAAGEELIEVNIKEESF